MNTKGTMCGKPVFEIERREILKTGSEFQKKKLCDGHTFTSGDACAYRCTFCYVPQQFAREPGMIALRKEFGLSHSEMVVRRSGAVGILRAQLLDGKGRPRFHGPEEFGKVVYASPIVDCAATPELVRETVALCREILSLTPWTIRLLSKSSFLPRISEGLADIPGIRSRIIFGCSTGTLDDKLAASFEIGTAKVSKRIASIRELQADGWRTFGMACPMLPGADVAGIIDALGPVEHIWGEAINLRGRSFGNTVNALLSAGYDEKANALSLVSGPGSRARWESYCRDLFDQVAAIVPGERLHWLQYVRPGTRPWWETRERDGAICL